MNNFSREIIPPRFIGDGNFMNPGKLLDWKRFSSDALLKLTRPSATPCSRSPPSRRPPTSWSPPAVPASITTSGVTTWTSCPTITTSRLAKLTSTSWLTRPPYVTASPARIRGSSWSTPAPPSIGARSTIASSPANWCATPCGPLGHGLRRHLLLPVAPVQGRCREVALFDGSSRGPRSRIFRDVCELGADLNKLADEGLLSTKLVKSKVAVVFDYESQWATEHTATPTQEVRHWTEPLAWFRALADNGLTADVVPVRALGTSTKPSACCRA